MHALNTTFVPCPHRSSIGRFGNKIVFITRARALNHRGFRPAVGSTRDRPSQILIQGVPKFMPRHTHTQTAFPKSKTSNPKIARGTPSCSHSREVWQPKLGALAMRTLRKASYFPQVLEELKQERVKLEAGIRGSSGNFRFISREGVEESDYICVAPSHSFCYCISARQLPASRSAWRKPLSR